MDRKARDNQIPREVEAKEVEDIQEEARRMLHFKLNSDLSMIN